ncbi:hypothetical protein [Bacteroides sp.]|uniref:hypothetical protein n=1 Tax=Bacteroides sp. TaxID=29523 RepID=UPI0026189835|nr:hypothetical protein [Bacteroides sp.]MDD3039556.1 hypothetical protein [Bacteroides sp.]
MYYDEDAVCRCYPEKLLFDSVVGHFVATYDLDEVADAIILQRLAMTILRTMRNEKWVAQRGEIVERVRTSPDGTTESWFEPNAASAVISKLDGQLLSWLKSLNVNKAARDASKRAAGVGDLARLLSDISVSKEQVVTFSDDEDDA